MANRTKIEDLEFQVEKMTNIAFDETTLRSEQTEISVTDFRMLEIQTPDGPKWFGPHGRTGDFSNFLRRRFYDIYGRPPRWEALSRTNQIITAFLEFGPPRGARLAGAGGEQTPPAGDADDGDAGEVPIA